MIQLWTLFNDVFPKDNLPEIKDGAYVMTFDDKKM